MFDDKRAWLYSALQAYHPQQEGLTAYEKVNKHLFLTLLEQAGEACFARSHVTPGHMTASAWVTNLDATRVLLLKHKKLGIWLQFGGHCDGDGNALAVARRELEEECGITPAMALMEDEGIFDLDIQCIPACGAEPEHLHFDTRFHMRYDDTKPVPGSAENQHYKWFTLDEAEALVTPGHGRWRMIQKTRMMQQDIAGKELSYGRA